MIYSAHMLCYSAWAYLFFSATAIFYMDIIYIINLHNYILKIAASSRMPWNLFAPL